MSDEIFQSALGPKAGQGPSVCIVTYLPSPYQVEFFNSIETGGNIKLSVIYLKGQETKSPIANLWTEQKFLHRAITISDDRQSLPLADEMMDSADLVVFNYYRHPFTSRWIRRRANSGKPWCFWGERPGFRCAGLFGRVYRKWRLWPLARGRSAIWCVGKWAMERYRKEFGDDRQYFNMPYFSDLRRFTSAGRQRTTNSRTRRFLYCGALIHRKGVDVLAHAFLQVAREFQDLDLTFVGTGELGASLGLLMQSLRDRVRFKGFQGWDELPVHYRQADIAIAPSRYDGWALVVPEALASGLPVISTTATGAGIEFLVAGKNGWLVPPGELQPLTDALRLAASITAEDLNGFRIAALAAVSRHQLEDGVERFTRAVAGSLEPFA